MERIEVKPIHRKVETSVTEEKSDKKFASRKQNIIQ